jgi:hypothetical protein
MSIGKRASETLASLASGDAEAALLTACVLVGATSRLEYPYESRDSVRYKSFISSQIWIIGLVAFQIVAEGYKVRCLHPGLKPRADGTVLLEDVLYKVVRCGLLHEADISSHVQLSASTILGYEEGKYIYSERLPRALLVAAMLSPKNSGEELQGDYTLRIGRRDFPAQSLWGKRNEILKLLVANEL